MLLAVSKQRRYFIRTSWHGGGITFQKFQWHHVMDFPQIKSQWIAGELLFGTIVQALAKR